MLDLLLSLLLVVEHLLLLLIMGMRMWSAIVDRGMRHECETGRADFRTTNADPSRVHD